MVFGKMMGRFLAIVLFAVSFGHSSPVVAEEFSDIYMKELKARSVAFLCKDKWFLQTTQLNDRNCHVRLNHVADRCNDLMRSFVPDPDKDLTALRAFGELYGICLQGLTLLERHNREYK